MESNLAVRAGRGGEVVAGMLEQIGAGGGGSVDDEGPGGEEMSGERGAARGG